MSESPTGNYFVAAYPPFSAWTTEQASGIAAELAQLESVGESPWGVYIHLPYCEKRCDFCYYLAFAGTSQREMSDYVERLAREAEAYAKLPRFAGRRPSFVYIGGGTPSRLPADALGRLLERLGAVMGLQGAEEITFECSPKSISREKLALLHAAGVNRISLGVQQLDDDVLRASHRIHLVADVYRAVTDIREFDFPELNIDLISGLPTQTDSSFTAGLEAAIALAPDCVTIYQLEVPGNTPLYRSVVDREPVGDLADWETKRQRVASGFVLLQQHGYAIRNAYCAALSRRHRRFTYVEEQYRGCDLIGLGLSSFSYVAGTHFQNTTSPEKYASAIDAGQLPIVRGHRLGFEERMVREFVLQLKLGHISRDYFRNKFDTDPVERFAFTLSELAAEGWIAWDDECVRLTPSGLVRVDRLLPAFYLRQHQESSYW